MTACLHIGQVLASTGYGGLEKHVRELSQALIACGHRVEVLAPASFIDTLPSGVAGIPLPLTLTRYHPLALWKLLHSLRQQRFDLVHAHASKAAFMLGSIRHWLSCPTVATRHNDNRRLTAFNRHNRVIAVSRYLAQGLPKGRCDVVYHGLPVMPVEMVHASPPLAALAGVNHQQPVLLAVGRLVKAKGFDLLIQAMHGLPASLVIVGDGPERAHLQRLADGSLGQVKLLGQRDDARALMHSADAVIISSRREGFSYVFAEALLARRPVLATNVPIANEVLPASLIVPTHNPAALHQRLGELLPQFPYWREQMQTAFSFAQTHLTLHAMTENTLQVYHHILQADHHLQTAAL